MKQLIFRNPANGLRTRVFDDFDRAFEQFWGLNNVDLQSQNKFDLGYELTETDDAFQISLDVPGVSKEEIKVEIDGNKLTVSGERKTESTEEKRTHKIWSRSYGSFEQSFVLPDDVDGDNIKAKHENGVLSLTLPKTEKVIKKTITIS